MIAALDMTNFAYRAAWSHAEMRSPTGERIGAFYGFIQSVSKVLSEFREIQEIIVCSDPVLEWAPCWRREAYAGYKAQRAEERKKGRAQDMHLSVKASQPWIRWWCSTINCTWLEDKEAEADDLLAWVARNRTDQKVVLFSGDKDMRQTVSPDVEVAKPQKSQKGGRPWPAGYAVFTADNFSSRLNETTFSKSPLTPEQQFGPEYWPAFRALMGDESDGLPGLVKVGDKTAATIINFSRNRGVTSLHPWDLFETWRDQGPEKPVAKVLTQNSDIEKTLRRNYELMNLEHAPQPQARAGFTGKWDPEAAYSGFQRLNFKSLLPGGQSHSKYKVIGRVR